jgi:hypothetical protein
MPTSNERFTLTGSDGTPYASPLPGIFGGHRGGERYGCLDCRAARQAIARGGYIKHRIFFADEATAIAAGYRPCAIRMPQAHTTWKKSQPAKTASGTRKAARS